jgi:hypothetical protein
MAHATMTQVDVTRANMTIDAGVGWNRCRNVDAIIFERLATALHCGH